MSDVLAQLIAAGVRGGADLPTLRAIVEEAGELGATRALTRLGLADEAARGDLAELRELIGAWRAAKTSAWKAAAGWFAALLLTGLAVKLGFGAWVR
ncbi:MULTISPECIES: DUF6127 family protein [unclassified Sphingomonas]|jgi:Family of unknown function (DUF6127)|uniref:DUF6127 family protein n=1 Tax=unclassified Sphingomonas TaxID=196159 RepID=UPI000E107331|nr:MULTISPECIES: DUF6127 family protein [unclassified Sphingomonas]AXJ95481.1 hypothetical protein DM480_08075 [Sphingomonas sp. FARSPH]